MASRDHEDARGFLSRWSERKRAAEEAAEDAAAPAPADPGSGPDARSGVDNPSREIDVAKLPDIDSLDSGSDFSAFLQEGVPEALKRRALRKLWSLDPVFGHLDGLNDYDLDYTDTATVVQGLRSLYQVGRGMVLPEDEPQKAGAEADGEEPAAETAAPSAQTAETSPQESPALEHQASDGHAESPSAERVDAPPQMPEERSATGSATRRAPASGPPARSARLRRWGESES